MVGADAVAGGLAAAAWSPAAAVAAAAVGDGAAGGLDDAADRSCCSTRCPTHWNRTRNYCCCFHPIAYRENII